MPNDPTKHRIDTHANEVLQTQIDASVGVARSLIQSWLPPLKPGEAEDDEPQDTFKSYSTGRPDRLGVGAKYLSHADAMKHNTMHSKDELQLKNKILNQNRRAAQRNTSDESTPKKRKQTAPKEESSDDEDDSTSRATAEKGSASKKKIGTQGDFLSLYLTERKDKKKKKKNSATSA